MVASSQVKFVIVTPGRVAYTTAAAKEKFTSRPKQVIWTPYLEELLTIHGDIQVVDSPAQMLAKQQAEEDAAKKTEDKPKPVSRYAASAADKAADAPAVREPAAH